MLEFRIPKGKGKTNNRITTQVDFFRDLCGRITWDMVLDRREVQEN